MVLQRYGSGKTKCKFFFDERRKSLDFYSHIKDRKAKKIFHNFDFAPYPTLLIPVGFMYKQHSA